MTFTNQIDLDELNNEWNSKSTYLHDEQDRRDLV